MRLGNQVFELNGLQKGFGERLLIEDLSCIIPPGAIVGIVGANGAGKSTLFKMLTGELEPDAGQVSRGVKDRRARLHRPEPLGTERRQ